MGDLPAPLCLLCARRAGASSPAAQCFRVDAFQTICYKRAKRPKASKRSEWNRPLAKILVVEDDEDIRDLVRTVLELGGHELHEATTGEEGLAQARALRPDVILMDLSLAGTIDGLESTRRLRADTAFDRTPIIALTAHAMLGDRERSLIAGCDEHWTKPIVNLEEFRRMVERVAAGGRPAGGATTATTTGNSE